MTLEQDQATVRRVFDEIWNKKALHLIEDTYTHDFIDHDPTLLEPVSGTDGVRELFIGNLTAFPDLKFTVEDMISEGDKIVTRWSAEGTHTGKLLGIIPPTGKHASITGITISHMVDGKIRQSWVNYDQAGMQQKLGLAPDPRSMQTPVGKAVVYGIVYKNRVGAALGAAALGGLVLKLLGKRKKGE